MNDEKHQVLLSLQMFQGMPDSALSHWADGHQWLLAIPAYKCYMGLVCYLVSVILMSYRDLGNNDTIQVVAMVIGILSVLTVIATFVYIQSSQAVQLETFREHYSTDTLAEFDTDGDGIIDEKEAKIALDQSRATLLTLYVYVSTAAKVEQQVQYIYSVHSAQHCNLSITVVTRIIQTRTVPLKSVASPFAGRRGAAFYTLVQVQVDTFIAMEQPQFACGQVSSADTRSMFYISALHLHTLVVSHSTSLNRRAG